MRGRSGNNRAGTGVLDFAGVRRRMQGVNVPPDKRVPYMVAMRLFAYNEFPDCRLKLHDLCANRSNHPLAFPATP